MSRPIAKDTNRFWIFPQLCLQLLLRFATFIFLLSISPSAFAIDWTEYDHFDPKHEINTRALRYAVEYYDMIKDKIKNPAYLSVVDYTLSSGKKRFYIIDVNTGLVESFLTAHGAGSDVDNDSRAESFSNIEGSKKSSLGFYLTEATYDGKHGLSLVLAGLSKTNSNAKARAIVIHGADYVNENAARDLGRVGRSWGCPAVDFKYYKYVINKLKNGSLILGWHDKEISK